MTVLSGTTAARKSALPKASDRQILWRCFRYLRPYWKLEIGIYGLMILINLINILVPQLIRVGH